MGEPTREELADLLEDMADEIEAYVEDNYPEANRAHYPSIQADYDRDMDLVNQGRAVAAALRREEG